MLTVSVRLEKIFGNFHMMKPVMYYGMRVSYGSVEEDPVLWNVCCVDWQISTNISEVHGVCILRVKQSTRTLVLFSY